MLLVTSGTPSLLAVGGLGTAAHTCDPLHQQRECLLKFGDALTMALDFLQEDSEFKPITLRHATTR